ncbi:MAG: hypothetical protein L0Z54_05420 [Thermoplasmata archaeon]|nr:hypothetical protein [Thermoplasmata archaeon]
MALQDKNELVGTLTDEVALMERHIKVLDAVIQTQPIGVIRLARETGLKDHEVRYSLRMLEREGLIRPTSEGAISTKSTKRILPQLRGSLAELGNRLIVAAHEIEEETRRVS